MTIQLQAWSERPCAITASQAKRLGQSGLVKVLPDEVPDRWRLVADSHVGVVRLKDGLELRVVPRLAIPRLMFLLSYALDASGWRDIGPAFGLERDLWTAIAAAFSWHAEHALTPAPLCGYVAVEEQAMTMRGRLRIGDQLARWTGRYLPLELSYDDYTIDIPENRLIRGATELLLRLPIRSALARRRLLRIRSALDDVSIAKPTKSISRPPITRLNVRYRAALSLAALILRSCSISARGGDLSGVSFVFDMNTVFEDFLSAALTTALERHGGRLIAQPRAGYLDAEQTIRLIPDLLWSEGGVSRAVIDAKYKRLSDERFPNADAYQMLAYCTALGLDRGYLVYAKNEGERIRDHTVANAGKTIHVRGVDVEAEPKDLLAHVAELADSIARASQSASTKPISQH